MWRTFVKEKTGKGSNWLTSGGKVEKWSWGPESDRRPTVYETVALPTELPQHLNHEGPYWPILRRAHKARRKTWSLPFQKNGESRCIFLECQFPLEIGTLAPRWKRNGSLTIQVRNVNIFNGGHWKRRVVLKTLRLKQKSPGCKRKPRDLQTFYLF
jgi:hypothetical protein